MPIYNYVCNECPGHDVKERNVPIAQRDEQRCQEGHKLQRVLVFTGIVYSNTHNGGHK